MTKELEEFISNTGPQAISWEKWIEKANSKYFIPKERERAAEIIRGFKAPEDDCYWYNDKLEEMALKILGNDNAN